MLITVLFGVAIGAVNGTLISIMGLPPFLATLCTCMITRGLGSVCSGSFAIPWPTDTMENGGFHNIFKVTIKEGDALYNGLRGSLGALFPMDKRMNIIKFPRGFIWIILLLLLMQFILSHTKFGRYTIAIGSNKEATMLSGVNVKFYHVMAYVVCGLFAGLAAIAYAAYTPTVQPGTGAGMELDAIGGAIVGGVSTTGGYGTIYGTVLGVYVIMLLKNGLPFMGLNANWQQVITGTVLIVAVLIDIIKRRAMKK
jgi:ribose transport system permease protein